MMDNPGAAEALAGKHVLLVQGLVQSGVTSKFLVRNLTARGATPVSVATLLDRSGRAAFRYSRIISVFS